MIIGSEVSSCASRPVEAMIWINEVEPAKCIADLKMSHTMTEAQKQTKCEVLESKTVSGLKKITHGDFETTVFTHQKKLHRKRNAFSRERRSHG